MDFDCRNQGSFIVMYIALIPPRGTITRCLYRI